MELQIKKIELVYDYGTFGDDSLPRVKFTFERKSESEKGEVTAYCTFVQLYGLED